MQKPLSIIVATEQKGGIGANNRLPWKIQKDTQFFRNKTTHTSSPDKINAVIMGRKTWDSLPHTPLRGRLNIVISSTLANERIAGASSVGDDRIFRNGMTENADVNDGGIQRSSGSGDSGSGGSGSVIGEYITKNPVYFSTLEEAIEYCDECSSVESIFVIGGGQLYSYCMENMLRRLDAVYWTRVKRVVEGCDCFFEPPVEFFERFRVMRLEEEEDEFTIVKYARIA
jgi:dihydrofolate reductase